VAQTIVDKGGDYVMIVKDHQPPLRVVYLSLADNSPT